MEIEFSLKEYVASCNEDICSVKGRIIDAERELEYLQNITGWERMAHRSKINARIKTVQATKSSLEQQLASLQLELQKYNLFGIDYYLHGNGKNDETQLKQMEARRTKMEIVQMIDLGMM